jgi:hypothetical protein
LVRVSNEGFAEVGFNKLKTPTKTCFCDIVATCLGNAEFSRAVGIGGLAREMCRHGIVA